MKGLLIGLMAVLLVAGAVPARADVHTVNTGESIQAAIDAAGDGDTINVNAGTYDEVLSIQKSVHLHGNNATLTYTDDTTTREQLIMLGWNKGGDLAGGATVQGFTLVADVGLDGDKDLIKIRANGTAEHPITIKNNTFQGDSATRYLGIETAYDAGHVVVEDNEFHDLAYGAWFNVLTDASIKRNVIENSIYSGLAICTSGVGVTHDIEVSNNVITKSGYNAHPDYQDGIWSAGIHLGSTLHDATFFRNEVRDNWGYGIVLHDRGTTALGNVSFNENAITDTVLDNGMLNDTSVLLDGRYNWWGDNSGPGPVGPGSGDGVSTNVDYDPWLVDPTAVVEGGAVDVTPDPVGAIHKGSDGMGGYAPGPLAGTVELDAADMAAACPNPGDYVSLKLSYDEGEVALLGLIESSMRPYWWDAANETWILGGTATDGSVGESTFAGVDTVPGSFSIGYCGVNTVDNYVWVNTNHASEYGQGGSQPVPEPAGLALIGLSVLGARRRRRC